MLSARNKQVESKQRLSEGGVPGFLEGKRSCLKLFWSFHKMFAVKQAARCLTRQLHNPVAPNIHLNHGLPSRNSPLRRALSFAGSQAYFSSSILASSAEKAQPLLNSQIQVAVPIQAEPDVLYHMIEVETRSSEKAVLQSYNKVINLTAEHLGLTIGHSEIAKKPHIKRWTVLKSRHVHKKHMVQYEVRTYHHKIQINRITGSTADTFLEYIQRNLPEGVSMRVGRVRMEKLPDHLLTPPSSEDLE